MAVGIRRLLDDVVETLARERSGLDEPATDGAHVGGERRERPVEVVHRWCRLGGIEIEIEEARARGGLGPWARDEPAAGVDGVEEKVLDLSPCPLGAGVSRRLVVPHAERIRVDDRCVVPGEFVGGALEEVGDGTVAAGPGRTRIEACRDGLLLSGQSAREVLGEQDDDAKGIVGFAVDAERAEPGHRRHDRSRERDRPWGGHAWRLDRRGCGR